MVHLDVHSHYSFLEGVPSVRQLVARAVEHNMPALALTDTNGLYGAIPFYKAAKAAGINPILGARLGGVVFLARDREGYARLCHIITKVKLGEVAVDQFGEWPFPFGGDHLFVITADRKLLRELPRRGISPLVRITHAGHAASHHQADALHRLARREGLRPVAVSPVYFMEPNDYTTHRVLTAIRQNTTIGQLDPRDLAASTAWFHAPRDLERLYASWPDALDNAAWVAEETDIQLPLGKPRFPECALPPGKKPFSMLWKKAFAGLQQRYPALTPKIMDRFRHELHTIDRLGFAPYFLIVSDLVDFAHKRGIPAVGRGSAANSLVAYALRITRADPFKYDLYFERFLNPGRTDCPDIDLDLCWRRRDEVINYVYETYGADHVAMIATHNTFRARAALREAAKAHGLTDAEISRIARVLPRYGARDLRNAVKGLPECRGLDLDEEPLRSILPIAERIDGFPRHLAMHACGLVIAPEPLTRITPLERAAKGMLITQYDMHPIEDLGLVKIDLLGHRALSVIHDTVETIREERGIPIDIEALPEPDPLTADLLRRGDTIACFQIESPAMRGLLRKIQAHDTHTLIQCIALVRPGASGSGMKQHFIDRHHGREAATYLHPALEKVLGETHGVMIYQEDVLRVAHAVTGMDLAQADALRRAMSKKRSPRAMAKNMKHFMERAKANGVPEEAAQEIWELIANFAAYSYCKAHAATYGELAYQCAYLKAHFPAEFFAAVLSNRGGFYAPPVYLEEAKRCGLMVHPPHINKSKNKYTAENSAIRVGFVEIRGLNQHSVEALLNARAAGPFLDLPDLHRRTQLPRADAEALFHAGALDGLPPHAPLSRPQQYWQLRGVYAADRKPTQTNEIPLLRESASHQYGCIPTYSKKHRYDREWETLGLLTQAHPFDYYLAQLQDRLLIPSTRLLDYAGQTVTLLGWMITDRRLALRTGKGVMKFITLEDTQGAYEAIFFPEAYAAHGHLLTTHGPYLLTGQAQNEHGAPTLLVEQVERAKGPRHWKHFEVHR